MTLVYGNLWLFTDAISGGWLSTPARDKNYNLPEGPTTRALRELVPAADWTLQHKLLCAAAALLCATEDVGGLVGSGSVFEFRELAVAGSADLETPRTVS